MQVLKLSSPCCVFFVQGEDEVRDSGVPYAVVRPCALTEEPAGADLVISQGDTIKVAPLSFENQKGLTVNIRDQTSSSNVNNEQKTIRNSKGRQTEI